MPDLYPHFSSAKILIKLILGLFLLFWFFLAEIIKKLTNLPCVSECVYMHSICYIWHNQCLFGTWEDIDEKWDQEKNFWLNYNIGILPQNVKHQFFIFIQPECEPFDCL